MDESYSSIWSFKAAWTVDKSFKGLPCPSVAKEIIPTDHPINEIFNAEHIPILITARNVNVSNLKTEQGHAIDHQLKWMSEEKKESPNVDPEGLWQQCNFELIGAIPLDQLKFSTLDGNEIILFVLDHILIFFKEVKWTNLFCKKY